jgi:hypothetical protein
LILPEEDLNMRMRTQAGCALLLLATASAGQEKGFQAERNVQEPTRLDWEFVAGKGASLPASYDSRRQRYQLFVPPSYTRTREWPLVLFVSPGDDPLGWRAWQTPCEEAGWLFAAPYGAGNACPRGQRVRAVLDVLDDVRRHYRLDPERTYLAGAGGGAELAAAVAFALPEYAGGVIAFGGDAPLPQLPHLRHRLRDRLSVALVCGKDDPARPLQEKFLTPLLRDRGVRSRLWLVAADSRSLPPADVLVQVQAWLEEDLERRRKEAEATGLDVRDTPTRRQLTARALDRAERELRDPGRLSRAAALLEWIVARGGSGDAAVKASELLQELREDEVRGRLLLRRRDAEALADQAARARALESLGDLEAARRTWDAAARLADGDERTKALAEARRLAERATRSPYLGLTFAGTTLTIREVAADGPAAWAGARAGDTLISLGKVPVTSLAGIREQLLRLQPGDDLAVGLRRGGKPIIVSLRVGATPKEL